MLDLQPGVGLDEGEAALAVDEELHGGQGAVLHGRAELLRRLVQGLAQGALQDRRGALDELLVAPLDRAVTVADRQHAPAVGHDLHLDMPRVGHQPFGVDRAVAERRQGLAGTGGEGEFDLRLGLHHPHAAPAAASHGLEHHRAVLLEEGLGAGQVDGAGAGQYGDLGLGRQRPGLGLIAEQFEGLGGRADEGDLGCGAGPGEGGVLRQEAVAGVDGVAFGRLGRGDDPVDVEIGFHAGALQRHGFVSGAHVQGGGVVLGEDGHAGHAQFRRRPGDADGDLAPVGDQHALEAQGLSPAAHTAV